MKLLTVKEVSEVLNVNTPMLYYHLRERNLKGIKMGRSWRIPEENLIEWLEKNTNKEMVK